MYSSLNLKMADNDINIDKTAELKIIESDRKYIKEYKNKR